jgi:hypothetical protein
MKDRAMLWEKKPQPLTSRKPEPEWVPTPTPKLENPPMETTPTINLQDHCLTVGPKGQVKAEIRARQVVVQGSVNGNVTAREKIEIRKTGQVMGDLVATGVAIEDGAYFKGSIEILREGDAHAPIAPRSVGSSTAASATS